VSDKKAYTKWHNKTYYCANKKRIDERRKLYREINKARISHLKKKSYRRNLAYYKRYNELNKDRLAREKREYYFKNKLTIGEYKKRWRDSLNGSSSCKMSVSKWRSKARNVIHSFTAMQWTEKIKSTQGVCPGCNVRVGITKLTLDHTFPLSKAKVGRVYTIDDVQPLCLTCNLKKSNKPSSVSPTPAVSIVRDSLVLFSAERDNEDDQKATGRMGEASCSFGLDGGRSYERQGAPVC